MRLCRQGYHNFSAIVFALVTNRLPFFTNKSPKLVCKKVQQLVYLGQSKQ